MRPPSSPGDPGLFGAVLAKGEAPQAVSDGAWLEAMLETEAALAEAWAELDRIPASHAAAIRAVCTPERYDIAALGLAAAEHANPVLPLVRAIRGNAGGEAAPSVHFGATSQDILDTAAMLVAYRACAPILASMRGAAAAAARLARQHRESPMMARTLLQPAEPITFGVTAGGWLIALSEAASRLAHVRESRLAVQLGGPVGVLVGYPAKKLAEKLGLQAPRWAWHTNRSRISELAGALGGACGVLGKVARDVTLLAHGEVSEARPGSSSAMPHKRNPVASISALGCAMQAPGLVATLHATMVQELQRAAGAWHAEWMPLRDLLVCTGSAAAWLHECLDGLRFHGSAVDREPDLAACRAYVDLALEAYG
jgi:3-carboxy-cis,cis-muconate cycloisomerase